MQDQGLQHILIPNSSNNAWSRALHVNFQQFYIANDPCAAVSESIGLIVMTEIPYQRVL